MGLRRSSKAIIVAVSAAAVLFSGTATAAPAAGAADDYPSRREQGLYGSVEGVHADRHQREAFVWPLDGRGRWQQTQGGTWTQASKGAVSGAKAALAVSREVVETAAVVARNEEYQKEDKGVKEDEREERGQEGEGGVAAAAAGVLAALAAAVGAALSAAAPSAAAALVEQSDAALLFASDGGGFGEEFGAVAVSAQSSSSAAANLGSSQPLAKAGGLRGSGSVAAAYSGDGGSEVGESGASARRAGGHMARGVGRRALQGATPSPVADAGPATGAPVPSPNDTPTPAQPAITTPVPVDETPITASPAPTPVETEVATPAPSETAALSPATPTPVETAIITRNPVEVAFITPAPVKTANTPAPAADPTPSTPPAVDTPAPVEIVADTPAPAGVNTPAPTLAVEETIAPSLVDSATTVPPGASLAPDVTLPPGATVAPVATLAPGATLAPNGTLAPGGTPSPTVARTASPTQALSDLGEGLTTTGEAVSSTATVAVASTAAAATVTAVTASATVATTTATSTVTTITTAAVTGGSAGGTGAATTTTTTTVAGVSGGGTTTGTVATTTGYMPDGTTFQSTATSNANVNVNTNANLNTNGNGPRMGTQSNSVSARSPSATLGLLMIFQMQFVSLLRMMEANITKPFMDFLDSLAWLNLHFEVDISFLNCNDEDTRFNWTNDDNGTWALNTFLVFFLLITIIIVHILLVSYLEASWLSRANAIHRHRLEFIRKRNAEEASAPFDGRTEAAYAKYLDAQNQDRELYEQEKLSTERFLKRHKAAWMYFPHVELLFLLFAYQGASAAEARMIYSGCFPLVVLGLVALVVFPLAMFLYVNRIVWSRIRPDHSPLRFELKPNPPKGCFLFRACGGMCNAWRHGTSMFEWADKGEWASKNNEEIDLDSRKFRIGFEPLFVDYTQKGSLYVTYLLFEWFAFGLIAGFVTDGRIQTAAICLIYTVDFLILVCLKPFSNSIIQCFTTMTVFADALTLGLMCYASFLRPDDNADSDRLELVYASALMVQTLAILFFVVPIYVDAFITILGTLCKACSRVVKRTKTVKAKDPIKGSSSETAAIFCALVRENFIGCARSTWRGPTYKPVGPTEMQRRQTARLMPTIGEDAGDSEEDEHANPGFGRVPSRPVRSKPDPARHPQVASQAPRNVLRELSDTEGGEVGYQESRSSRGSDDAGQYDRRGSRGGEYDQYERRGSRGGDDGRYERPGSSRSSGSGNHGGRRQHNRGPSTYSMTSDAPSGYSRSSSVQRGNRR